MGVRTDAGLLLPFLSWLWSSVGKYVPMIGAAVVTIGGLALAIFAKGDASGKAAVEQAETKAVTKAVTQTNQADESVDEMSDAQVNVELQKWESK